MKIVMQTAMGDLLIGEERDAAVNTIGRQAYVFDKSGLGWLLCEEQFRVVPADNQYSVAGLTGHGVKSITIEMK